MGWLYAPQPGFRLLDIDVGLTAKGLTHICLPPRIQHQFSYDRGLNLGDRSARLVDERFRPEPPSRALYSQCRQCVLAVCGVPPRLLCGRLAFVWGFLELLLVLLDNEVFRTVPPYLLIASTALSGVTCAGAVPHWRPPLQLSHPGTRWRLGQPWRPPTGPGQSSKCHSVWTEGERRIAQVWVSAE